MAVHSKTILALTALTLSGALLSGCAAANPGAETPVQVADRGPDPCFKNSDIINVNIIDKQTLFVATQRGYVYKLDAPGGCFIQGAPITVGAFSGGPGAGTCIGSQARVAVGSSFRFPSSQCIAQISGPYTDSRQSGLWSRPVAR
ncbi:hypothetical protein BH10PSE1_BH10PSE1_20250 [soil metagenome]